MKEIFIVEDDQGIRELLSYLLESQNLKVHSFPTAEEFQKEISQRIPDVILMDIMLPDGNGVDICKNLKAGENTHEVPVVLMSAHADSTILTNHCANDFIAKPFDIAELVNKINLQLA